MALHDPAPRTWVQHPRAAVILASLAERHPPAIRHFPTFATTRDEWVEYVGFRVECLKAIHEKLFFEMEAASIAADMPGLMDAFANEPTVQRAVQAVVEGRAA